jgi:hypothetical protein
MEELHPLIQKKRVLKWKWGSNETTYNVLYIKTIKLPFQSHTELEIWLQEYRFAKQ